MQKCAVWPPVGRRRGVPYFPFLFPEGCPGHEAVKSTMTTGWWRTERSSSAFVLRYFTTADRRGIGPVAKDPGAQIDNPPNIKAHWLYQA